MITIKSKYEIECMQAAGKIAAMCMKRLSELISEGISTKELDTAAERFINSQGAGASFKNYRGFPASICSSINQVVVHGIPNSNTILKNGDIISIDLGVKYKGYHGDMAKTFPVGQISDSAKEIIKVTRNSFYEGVKKAVNGNRIGDISHAIQTYAEAKGYSVVRDLIGHGIGEMLHEEPDVPNFGREGKGPRLVPGMTIAIEPMINEGTFKVNILDDGWTVVTQDNKLSSHHEHTVLVTKDEPIILTKL